MLSETPNDPVAGGPTRSAVFRHRAHPTSPTFSDASTLYEVFESSCVKFANEPCLGHRPIGPDGKAQDYVFLTYKETHAKAAALASALKGIGIQKGQRVAVLGANCPEWMLCVQACNRMSYECVPLYDTLGENAIEYIIDHSESVVLFVSSEKMAAFVKALPLVQSKPANVIYWGVPNPTSAAAVQDAGVKVHAFEEFVAAGAAAPLPADPPTPSDLCTIMYTSGTTGDPKGVLLTHSAVVHTLASLNAYLGSMKIKTFGVGDCLLSYLPLAHIFDRTAEELVFVYGGKIGYWQGKLPELMSDIAALKPTMFIGVPRVFDRIYAGITDKIAKAGCVKGFLFNWGYKAKLARLQAGFTSETAAPFWDKLLFNKVKEGLGGNVRVIVSGGAPLAPHIEEFLKVTMCAPVVQGYGLTETCAASFISMPDDPKSSGTVGPPQPVTQFCLESVPEMNYDALATPPRGELLMKGENLFSGYYKMQDKTDEVLEKSGWFHSGDIVELQPDGTVKIIDRKKNIFKLSQGEYIAVEKLEAEYKKCPSVNQVWVYGNSFESCVVCVVVPKEEKLQAWAHAHHVKGTFAELCANKEAIAFILQELTQQAPLSKLKGFEVVKAVHLDPREFTIERDLVTPTFKLKRPQLQKEYQAAIDKLYEAVKSRS